jgi:membrane protein
MNAQPPSPARADERRDPKRLFLRTLARAWHGNIFSEAAEAAFWQVLSLPPLLLGLLGILGHVGDWLGPQVVISVQERIIGFCRTIFSGNVVTTIIEPTVNDILTKSQAEVASVGFLLSLWAGSSAMASFVDAITVAYGQYGIRNEVWQRIFALLLYLVGLVLAIIGLPILALGPNYLPKVFPGAWRPTISTILGTFYYPVMAVLLVVALATLYRVALPRKLPWYRGVPGAVLAMVVFLLGSIGLRIYLTEIGRTGYTYGALAAPIAFLLFTYFIGLAIVIGAHFNSAIQEMWPARVGHRRRRWRRLDNVRASEVGTQVSTDTAPPADNGSAAEVMPGPRPEAAASEPEPQRQERRS